MSLLRGQNLVLRIGEQVLLDKASFSLEAGERVALVGRNGTGKSTLLRLIMGQQQAESGELILEDGARVAMLSQEPEHAPETTVIDVFFQALGETGHWLARHHRDPADGEATTHLGQLDAWSWGSRIQQALEQLDMEADSPAAQLSGGQQRRLELAAQMLLKPDLLLLDEPTNHLDMASIDQLIEDLRRSRVTLLLISHDRAFIDSLSSRILELDRGHLSSWPAPYERYLEKRAEALNAEALEQARMDKKLAEEERWVRQGIKARRTRNEGRVRALKALRREHAARRQQAGNVQAGIDRAADGGRRVMDVQGLHVTPGGLPLVTGLDMRLLRGDKLAIVGPNGAGKTTLVRTLLGQRPPDKGTVELGTGLEIGYFDQHRGQLNEQLSALDNVAEGREFIDFQGRSVHIISYLQNFLFTPERARAPIHRLSGGERNRLLLARVLSRPLNLLVLDEPTNDLDIDTLEVLEDMLVGFDGTLIVISHDRRFIDNIATQVLVLDGKGHSDLTLGGLPERLPWQKTEGKSSKRGAPAVSTEPAKPQKQPKKPVAKLSYKLQRELDLLPATIEALEQRLTKLQNQVSDPTLFQRDPQAGSDYAKQLAECEQELQTAFERWEALEEQKNQQA